MESNVDFPSDVVAPRNSSGLEIDFWTMVDEQQQNWILLRITFSLCSKKSSGIIKSLEIPIEEFKLAIQAKCCLNVKIPRLRICHLWFSQEAQNVIPGRLAADFIDGFISGRHRAESRFKRWYAVEWRGNDWLRHFMSIFNQRSVQVSVSVDRFDVESIADILKDLKVSHLKINVPDGYCRELLRRLPEVENIEGFLESSLLPILLNNYHSLNLQIPRFPNLDDLLSINCLTFESQWANISSKDLNRFLKLWMSKGSNPRLRRCQLRFLPPDDVGEDDMDEILQEDVIMRGIQYHRIPEETQRVFVIHGDGKLIRGGLDIVKKDGIKATVIIRNHVGDAEEESIFQLFVWI